ncbi:other/Haspin protein kinase [Mycena metata]|uniref:non-specific serine/threonine protein kinase n=1 Tax=Mycena metata TaxID=1033252 RepID=A0AAD7K940_9AGAR|nr:other/Haspin protein kinase [Mycena metata]
MLGHHTKQVNVYGKRRQRIVNASETRLPKEPPSIFDDLPPTQWAPVASRMKKRENGTPKSKSQSPKILHMSRKKRLSPVISPVRKRKTMPQIRRLEDEAELFTPPRRPFGVKALNTPGSPAVVSKPKRTSGNGIPYPTKQSFSPFVDILVFDDEGTTISQERRVSGLMVSDSEDELTPQPKPPRRLRRLVAARVESDESGSSESGSDDPRDAPSAPPIPAAPARGRQPRLQVEVVLPLRTRMPLAPANIPSPAEKPSAPPTTLPPLRKSIPTQPEPPLRYQHVASPIPRARQLTPIRGARRMFAPPSPPSPTTPSEDDLAFDISALNITPPPAPAPPPAAPAYLQPLLAECGQQASGLLEFSAFIRSFPFDPLVCGRGGSAGTGGFRKIGEASYSEVFGIGDVVLKVIPLRDETQRRLRPNAAVESEAPFATDAKDVLKEVIVTHAMGQVCDGFVKLLRTYIVKGTYPQVLLELWDEYYERKGSEGIRPDTFALSQAYAIIVLPNGGPDLEAYTFASKGGWKQACSVFWQVAKALAHAEQLVSFEHRDLHLGQILVRETSAPDAPRALQTVNQNRVKATKAARPMMDDPVHGVRATLIDLGLSRMDAGDGSGGEMVHWTPFEDEIFMGEGDYQFDIYRYMRAHNGGDWEAFNPLTNALWLHYLAVKLLKGKGLRAPTRRKSQAPSPPSAGFTDRDCYECMLDLEEWLGRCVAAVVAEAGCKPKGKGKKKKAVVGPPTHTPAAQLLGPLCAGEVVGYAVKKGWIRALA